MKYDKEKLLKALNKCCGKDFDTSPDIINALDLFKKIKQYEKSGNQEIEEAKFDLVDIFSCEDEIKGKTKNQIYMLHQSKMVNGIYDLLKGE